MRSSRIYTLCAWLTVALFCGIIGCEAWGQAPRWNPTTKPTFPVAAWDVPAKQMDVWKARGINVLIGCGLEVADTPVARLAWAKEAEKRGLWVIADFQGSVPPNVYAFLLPDEMDAKQANPAIPKWDGLTHDQIRPLYDNFKRLAPDVPVFMSLAGDHVTGTNRINYYQTITDCSDIWMEDGYPRNRDATRYNEALWPGRAVAVLKQAAPNKPLWAMLECDWQNLKDSPNGRAPTAAEVQSAIDTAAANGATGIGYFSHVFNGKGGWVDWDRTAPDVADVITRASAKLNPPTSPEVAALRAQVAELNANLAVTNARQDAMDEKLNRIGAELMRPATRPTTQPGGMP
jgi:hypothetical protein